MNPLIELYQRLHFETGTGLKIKQMDYKDVGELAVEASKKATDEQHTEFLDWTENRPEAVAAREEAEKDAEEVRKHLERLHKQNELPGQFPNDKYAG